MFGRKRRPPEPWENGVDQFGADPDIYKIDKQVNRLGEERWVVRSAYFVNRDGSYSFTDGPKFNSLEDAQNHILSRTWTSV